MKKLIALFCVLILMTAMLPTVMAETVQPTNGVRVVKVTPTPKPTATPKPTPTATPAPTVTPLPEAAAEEPAEEVAVLAARPTPTPTKRPVVTKVPVATGKLAYVKTPNKGSLNARRTMFTNSKNRVDSLPYGYEVTVISDDGTWAYVQFYHTKTDRRTNAYVKSCYLVDKKPSDTAQVTILHEEMELVVPYTVQVNPTKATGWVNMRTEPATNAKLVESCRKGTQLTVTAKGKEWAMVTDPGNGKSGYMQLVYLK